MQPLGHENQSQQVGAGTQLLNNAVAAAKFLAHIPEKAAGFVGKQATAVYSSLPLTHKKTEEGVNNQEKKSAVENPKPSRSFTGTLATLAEGAGNKVQRAFTQVPKLTGKIAAKVTEKKVSVEEFKAKLEEVQTTRAQFIKVTRDRSDTTALKQQMKEQLALAKMKCGDERLEEQMKKNLKVTSRFVEGRGNEWLSDKKAGIKNMFEELFESGFDPDSYAIQGWREAHEELTELDSASQKDIWNLMHVFAQITDAASTKDLEMARAHLLGARGILNTINPSADSVFSEIIKADMEALENVIQGALEQNTEVARSENRELFLAKDLNLAIKEQNSQHYENLKGIHDNFKTLNTELKSIKLLLNEGLTQDLASRLEILELELSPLENRLENLVRDNPAFATSLAIANFQNFIAETRVEIEALKDRLK